MENVTIWPSHYFIPWHHSDPDNVYSGPEKIYAEQQWGTTRYLYNKKDVAAETTMTRAQVNARAAQLRRDLVIRSQLQMDPKQLGADADDVGLQAAEQRMKAWDKVSQSPVWKKYLRDLNETLSKTLISADFAPRVESEPFYSLRQNRDLPDCDMIVKTEALRTRLSAWMSGANSVVQIGTGGGHLALLQKLLCPEAHLVTVDRGGAHRWGGCESCETLYARRWTVAAKILCRLSSEPDWLARRDPDSFRTVAP